jgi:hypothetical protein
MAHTNSYRLAKRSWDRIPYGTLRSERWATLTHCIFSWPQSHSRRVVELTLTWQNSDLSFGGFLVASGSASQPTLWDGYFRTCTASLSPAIQQDWSALISTPVLTFCCLQTFSNSYGKPANASYSPPNECGEPGSWASVIFNLTTSWVNFLWATENSNKPYLTGEALQFRKVI